MFESDPFIVRESKSSVNESSNKIIVLYFGNPLVEEDSMALEVGRRLKRDIQLQNRYRFIECLKPEDFFDEITSNQIIILDVAENSTDILEINDPDLLSINSIYSAHQQNLSFYLKLFKAMGDITNIRILTIPTHGNIDQLASKVSTLLQNPKKN